MAFGAVLFGIVITFVFAALGSMGASAWSGRQVLITSLLKLLVSIQKNSFRNVQNYARI